MKRALLLLALGACVDASDPVWQLDHDRVIAVRVTPPHIDSGARATVDGLLAHKGGSVDVEPPIGVTAAPGQLPALAAAVQPDGSIVAPDAATLDAARAQLQLAAGAPVPLEVGAAFGPQPMLATKVVFLGDSADNPALPAVTVNGATPADGATIEIPFDMDVPMSVTVDPMWKVAWLTSCGTMHDDDEHAAFVHVLPADPTDGQLALVVRDAQGGVVWDWWPMHSTAPTP